MSGVRAIGERYVVEIDNHDKREGLLCMEGFIVRVCDDGGGPFLAVQGRNLDPTDEYDATMVTLAREDIQRLATVLTEILDQADQVGEATLDRCDRCGGAIIAGCVCLVCAERGEYESDDANESAE